MGLRFLEPRACPRSVGAHAPSVARRGRVSGPCREGCSCQRPRFSPPPLCLGRKALGAAFRWAYSNRPFLLPPFFFLRQISC